ncbi:hypothetical protein OH77DRAFT_989662 [Trametes cingulata]|nr:hypothetical protein OH77DRAFT_989662 [Trametes cingulata]
MRSVSPHGMHRPVHPTSRPVHRSCALSASLSMAAHASQPAGIRQNWWRGCRRISLTRGGFGFSAVLLSVVPPLDRGMGRPCCQMLVVLCSKSCHRSHRRRCVISISEHRLGMQLANVSFRIDFRDAAWRPSMTRWLHRGSVISRLASTHQPSHRASVPA